MPRFVLLHHECPPGSVKLSHWDFMLAVEGVLWTWELRELPAAWLVADGETASGNHDPVVASRLVDHRVAYLDYEGPLTKDRGNVSRIASGEFEILEHTPRRLVIHLVDERLCGTIELVETDQLGQWILSVRG